MNVYSLRRLALWHKQQELQQPVMTATRSATDFEIMQQEHIEQLKTELAEARAEIERLKGAVISQITPEPVVLSSYSTSTEPAKDERDKLIEQMREAFKEILKIQRTVDLNLFDIEQVHSIAEAALSAAARAIIRAARGQNENPAS